MRNVMALSVYPERIAVLRAFFAELPDFGFSESFDTLREFLTALEKSPAQIVLVDSEIVLAEGLAPLFRAEGAAFPLLVVLAPDHKQAARAFEVCGVVDYLVMPCSGERLARCVSRLRMFAAMSDAYAAQRTLSGDAVGRDFVFVKVNKRYVRLSLDDICYVESVKDYIKIVCEKKSFLVYNTLSNFTASLPAERFFRIHRSYTVAAGKVDWLDANTAEVAGVRLPVSKKYLADNSVKNLYLK